MMSDDHPPQNDAVRFRDSVLTKLTVFVALVVILSATVMNWIGYRFARQSLTNQIHERLDTVAHYREAQLNAYVAEQKSRAALVGSRTRLRKYLIDRLNNPGSEPGSLDGTTKTSRDAQQSTWFSRFLADCITRGSTPTRASAWPCVAAS